MDFEQEPDACLNETEAGQEQSAIGAGTVAPSDEPAFPQLKQTFAELCPEADLATVAARLEQLYFVPDFSRFATRGGAGKDACAWYYWRVGQSGIGWCRNTKTGNHFPRPFDLIEHLTSPHYYGTCLAQDTGTAFAGLDFDNLAATDEQALLRDCVSKARSIGLTPHLIYTGSTSERSSHLGAHLEFFFDGVVDVHDARAFFDWLTDGKHDSPGTAWPETFPTPGGAAYRLPFAVHKATGNLAVFVDPDSFTLADDQAQYLLNVTPDSFPGVAEIERRSWPGLQSKATATAQTTAPLPARICSSVPAFSLEALARLLEEGACPPRQSFRVTERLASAFATRWNLPPQEALEELLAWTERLPSVNHESSLAARKREVHFCVRRAYAQARRDTHWQEILRDCWERNTRSRAHELAKASEILLGQLKAEKRPNAKRRAVADVLGVFIAAETCLATADGTFCLSQRMLQDVLGSGATRVNKAMRYVVRREKPWGNSPPCEGSFFRQVTYPSRIARLAPAYRRMPGWGPLGDAERGNSTDDGVCEDTA